MGASSRVSVSAVSSWRWSLDEDLEFWADAGITQVGLSFRKLEAAGLDVAVARVRDGGLRVSNLVELGWCNLDDPSTWSAHQERLLAAVDVAASLSGSGAGSGTGCLVLTTGPAGRLDWAEAADALAEMLAPVRVAAVGDDVALTIEPTGPLRLDLSFVTTLRDGVELADRLGVGVCIEVNSCFAERGLLDTVRGAVDLVEHVQVSDFVIGSLCTPDRAVPGDGDIPLARIVSGIVDAGYRGAFELELVGPRIEEEGYASAITRGVAALDRILDEVPGDETCS
jgi:sugar phosphate isomerase/epimerase